MESDQDVSCLGTVVTENVVFEFQDNVLDSVQMEDAKLSFFLDDSLVTCNDTSELNYHLIDSQLMPIDSPQRTDGIRNPLSSINNNSLVDYSDYHISVQQMYRLYLKECETLNLTPVSIYFYREVFDTNFNLFFHPPKNDTCGKCDRLDMMIKTSDNAQDSIEEEDAENAYKEKRKDKDDSTRNEDIVTFETIGGSQGKFSPRPKDSWCRMKISGRQPRFLPDVMQAIVDLKDGGGSTQSKILEHIQSIINSKKITPKPRNVTMQIRRALKHGVQNGLIKQRGGKFQLGIHPRDFALFKTFRYMEPLKDCSKCKKGRRKRRGKRRRRSRRRRRGRRRTVKKSISHSDSDFSKKSGTPEPMECKNERKNIRRGGSFARSSKASSGTDQRSRSHRSSKGSILSQRGQRKYDNDDNPNDYQNCDHEVDRGDHQNYDSYVN